MANAREPEIDIIGSIQVRRRLAIVDPGYLHRWREEGGRKAPTSERWWRIVLGSLVPLPKGRYSVLAAHAQDKGIVDPHVDRLFIVPEGEELGPVIAERSAGAVAVDGGRVSIFDIADLDAVLLLPPDSPAPGLAVLSPSGYGDGLYGVFRREHSSLYSVEVDFVVHLDDDGEQDE